MSGFATDPGRSARPSRRTFLKRAGLVGAGVAGARLVAPLRAAAQDATVKADPAVKRGGTLRFGVNSAPAHFDVHQSGTNPAFHDLARQIEREVDEGRRKTMVRQAEAILESDPPLLPIAYEKIYDAWHNRVRGQNPSTFFGIYDVVRWDTVSVAS